MVEHGPRNCSQRIGPQRGCVACGCPHAGALLTSVLCPNPGCRWHDARWGADLEVSARAEVEAWLRQAIRRP